MPYDSQGNFLPSTVYENNQVIDPRNVNSSLVFINENIPVSQSSLPMLYSSDHYNNMQPVPESPGPVLPKQHQDGQVASFVKKLAKMLDPSKSNQFLSSNGNPLISWREDGSSFIIREPTKFTDVVIPAFFKHRNRASFIRQLNTYGFKKQNRMEEDNLNFTQSGEEILEYHNVNFHRDHPENWHQLGRRRPSDKKETTNSNEPQATASDIAMILNEIKNFQQRQTKMQEIVKTVVDENQKLQRQNQQLYERDRKNRNTMGKIVQVLYQLVNKEGGNSQTAKNIKEIIGNNSGIIEYPPSTSRKRPGILEESVPIKKGFQSITYQQNPTIEHVHTPPTIVEVSSDIAGRVKTVSGQADPNVDRNFTNYVKQVSNAGETVEIEDAGGIADDYQTNELDKTLGGLMEEQEERSKKLFKQVSDSLPKDIIAGITECDEDIPTNITISKPLSIAFKQPPKSDFLFKTGLSSKIESDAKWNQDEPELIAPKASNSTDVDFSTPKKNPKQLSVGPLLPREEFGFLDTFLESFRENSTS